MRFDISDDALLKVSGASALAYGTTAALAPKFFDDFHYKAGTPHNSDQSHYLGMVSAALGASTLTLANDKAALKKKDTLKVHGAMWLTAAALGMYHIQKGNMKRDVGIGAAVGQAGLGGVMLARGLRKA